MLNALPKSLDETYERILCRIDPNFRYEVLHILQWLTYSDRPLTLEEIAETVAFRVYNNHEYDEDSRLAEPADILALCSSLVVSVDGVEIDYKEVYTDENPNDDGDSIRSEDFKIGAKGTPVLMTKVIAIELAHSSVKEYLISDRIHVGSAAFFSINEGDSHATIAGTALPCLHLYNSTSSHSSHDFWRTFPLAMYSAKYWNTHLCAAKVGMSSGLYCRATELFLSDKTMRNWIALFDSDADNLNMQESAPSPGSPLYYAVFNGFLPIVEMLIQSHKNTG